MSKKHDPGKRPQTVWGGKGILHFQCDDYCEVHDDMRMMMMMMMVMMLMKMRMRMVMIMRGR